jgi:hypothetical protein
MQALDIFSGDPRGNPIPASGVRGRQYIFTIFSPPADLFRFCRFPEGTCLMMRGQPPGGESMQPDIAILWLERAKDQHWDATLLV